MLELESVVAPSEASSTSCALLVTLPPICPLQYVSPHPADGMNVPIQGTSICCTSKMDASVYCCHVSGHDMEIVCLAFNPQSTRVGTGSMDHTSKVSEQ